MFDPWMRGVYLGTVDGCSAVIRSADDVPVVVQPAGQNMQQRVAWLARSLEVGVFEEAAFILPVGQLKDVAKHLKCRTSSFRNRDEAHCTLRQRLQDMGFTAGIAPDVEPAAAAGPRP